MSSKRIEPAWIRPPKPEFGKPFITGSIAYGIPNVKSDIDLVIPIQHNADMLLRLFAAGGNDTNSGYALYFGKLNLICCRTQPEYQVWFYGTVELMNKLPKTTNKRKAISIFNKYRQKYGLPLSTITHN